MTYQDRLLFAMGQSEHHKTATDLARALGCSPQAVRLVLSGSSKAFGAANHSKTSELLGVRPIWLACGDGPMRQPVSSTGAEVVDPLLEDLAILDPEDADVWRAQIRAAAIKVRRKTEQAPRSF